MCAAEYDFHPHFSLGYKPVHALPESMYRLFDRSVSFPPILFAGHPRKVKTYRIERGGDVTFHGPGQLVGYPILDLHNYKKSISGYMRSLEQLIIDTLAEYEITAERKDRLTGVLKYVH